MSGQSEYGVIKAGALLATGAPNATPQNGLKMIGGMHFAEMVCHEESPGIRTWLLKPDLTFQPTPSFGGALFITNASPLAMFAGIRFRARADLLGGAAQVYLVDTTETIVDPSAVLTNVVGDLGPNLVSFMVSYGGTLQIPS